MQVTTEVTRLIALAAAVAAVPAAPGAFAAMLAVPLNGPITPTDDTLWADVSPLLATFTGSAAIAVVLTGPQESPSRQPYMNSQLLSWICSAAPGSPETIYAIAYYNVVGGHTLVGVDVLPTPVTITEQYDVLTWIATVP